MFVPATTLTSGGATRTTHPVTTQVEMQVIPQSEFGDTAETAQPPARPAAVRSLV
jgi:hypothetical protein